jgi:predicted ABC-type ATPase
VSNIHAHPTLYVIAGPNGAGKTTFAREYLPRFAHCEEFVNSDLIASGLAPFDPAGAALEAGRIMLGKLKTLVLQRQTFALETTLAGRNHARLLARAQKAGYSVTLMYLWIPTVALALRRVWERVQSGGHAVPERDVRRRFGRSLWNLSHLYKDMADELVIFDNSGRVPHLVAHSSGGRFKVWDLERWDEIQTGMELYHEK